MTALNYHGLLELNFQHAQARFLLFLINRCTSGLKIRFQRLLTNPISSSLNSTSKPSNPLVRKSLVAMICTLLHLSGFCMAPKVNLEKAIDHAVIRHGLKTEPELTALFNHSGVSYPPKEIALLAFKSERLIQLWGRGENHAWRYIKTYPLTASSGRLGPKLKENDRQIPEGIYQLTTFNPFSAHHLSLLIDYPNHFDRIKASQDGRTKLGGNIFLHGKATSVGCLAIGDKAIDQLFLLARRVGLKQIKLIIAPNDLRREKPATSTFAQPRWLPELYQEISTALKPFRRSKTV